MKKISKRLALSTQTIRVLQNDELRGVGGGTSVISVSVPSVIRPSEISVRTPSAGPSVLTNLTNH